MKFKQLTFEEEEIIINKGTEKPFSGKYNDFFESGVYMCKRCGTQLYKSSDKFNSHCGWPSFDDEIEGAIERKPDADGRRTEILCANCGAHLGHIFYGENYTPKNTRHCVNSLSLDFMPVEQQGETAIFAGGCFWGVEYHFRKIYGVISCGVGYIGGVTENPTYEEVCNNNTGHAEAVKVVFNPQKVSYETLVKLFLEIHDPTQLNRQGPDVGEQYRSEIFYTSNKQKDTAQKLLEILQKNGYEPVTKITKAQKFWPAEEYHQNYYGKKRGIPYCHVYKKRF